MLLSPALKYTRFGDSACFTYVCVYVARKWLFVILYFYCCVSFFPSLRYMFRKKKHQQQTIQDQHGMHISMSFRWLYVLATLRFEQWLDKSHNSSQRTQWTEIFQIWNETRNKNQKNTFNSMQKNSRLREKRELK